MEILATPMKKLYVEYNWTKPLFAQMFDQIEMFENSNGRQTLPLILNAKFVN